mgnify:CR=1 FL=1
MSLEPIEPETALELYLADRENNVTEATIYSHRSRLGHFVRWCDEQEIKRVGDLTPFLIDEFGMDRHQADTAATTTRSHQPQMCSSA